MPTPTIIFSPAGLRRKQCSRGKRGVIGSIPIAGLDIFLSHIFLLAKPDRKM
jgi:hypothetical protein